MKSRRLEPWTKDLVWIPDQIQREGARARAGVGLEGWWIPTWLPVAELIGVSRWHDE